MKQYKVLIVDDEPEARALLEHYLEQVTSCELVGSCKSAAAAFEKLNTQNVDLIFLDIHMPEISGVTFAKSLCSDVKIVFTTAHRDYAVEGFELKAVDYLLKPISLDRFLSAIHKFIGQQKVVTVQDSSNSSHAEHNFIFVRADRKMVKIDLDQIRLIESVQDYVKIYLEKQTIITRETISNLQVRLSGKGFMRCHRSYIVALRHIDSYTNEHLTMDRKSIPISRSFKDEVLQKLQSI